MEKKSNYSETLRDLLGVMEGILFMVGEHMGLDSLLREFIKNDHKILGPDRQAKKVLARDLAQLIYNKESGGIPVPQEEKIIMQVLNEYSQSQ